MSELGPRIAALARKAERDAAVFAEADSQPPVEEYLHEGVGQAIWLYVEGRTGGRLVQFSDAEYRALEVAMNTWLSLYAASHGVDLESDVTLRTAAEMLIETRNVIDTAQLLTGVPGRDDQ